MDNERVEFKNAKYRMNMQTRGNLNLNFPGNEEGDSHLMVKVRAATDDSQAPHRNFTMKLQLLNSRGGVIAEQTASGETNRGSQEYLFRYDSLKTPIAGLRFYPNFSEPSAAVIKVFAVDDIAVIRRLYSQPELVKAVGVVKKPRDSLFPYFLINELDQKRYYLIYGISTQTAGVSSVKEPADAQSMARPPYPTYAPKPSSLATPMVTKIPAPYSPRPTPYLEQYVGKRVAIVGSVTETDGRLVFLIDSISEVR